LGLSGPYLAHQAVFVASEDQKVSKQGTAEIIRRLESGEC
jgi:hypothetical protein